MQDLTLISHDPSEGWPEIPAILHLKGFSHGGLEGRRSLKADRLSGLHFDRLPGARVHAFAGLGFLDREGAETWQRETAVLFQLLHDRLDEICGGAARGNACNLGRVLDNVCNESFRHDLDNSFPVAGGPGQSYNKPVRDWSNHKAIAKRGARANLNDAAWVKRCWNGGATGGIGVRLRTACH